MDLKGRVTVPSKFREDLGDKFYVCKGLDGCLFLLSQAQWDKLVEKVSAIPLAQGKGIQRYFFSGAAEVEPDKQGRILILKTCGSTPVWKRTSPLSARLCGRRFGIRPAGMPTTRARPTRPLRPP